MVVVKELALGCWIRPRDSGFLAHMVLKDENNLAVEKILIAGFCQGNFCK